MYKLAFNNLVVPLLLFVLTVAIGIAGVFFNVFPIPLPAWILLCTIILFLGSSLILYPSGGPQKIAPIAGITLGIYVLSMIIIVVVALVLGKNPIAENLNLKISLIALVLPILMSMFITKFLVKLEKIEVKQTVVDKPVIQTEETPVVAETIAKPIEPVLPVVEQKETQIQKHLPQEPVQKIEESQSKVVEDLTKEVFFEDIMEEKPSHFSVQEEQKPQPVETEPEVFFEDIIDKPVQEAPVQPLKQEVVEPETVQINEPVKAEISEEPQFETLEPLGELPELAGDLEDLSETVSEPEISVSEVPEPEVVKPEIIVPEKKESIPVARDTITVRTEVNMSDQPAPYIPALNESPRSKDVDSAGRITSIGKLLVDHRDIENIIETNALMQGISTDATMTKIISAVAGGKTNEKLSTLSSLDGVKYSFIVNDAGFVQASTLNDIHKEQVLGALASGCFGIISNSLNKLGFQPAKDISFETNTCSIILHRHSSNIITIFIDSEVSLYSLNAVNESLVTAAEREPKDLISTFTSINGIIGVVLSNKEGDLVASRLIDESKNPHNIAKVLPAFYNNLAVFAKNMDDSTLRKAVISTGNELLLFTSLSDNILCLYSTLNTAIIPNDIKIQYESVINT